MTGGVLAVGTKVRLEGLNAANLNGAEGQVVGPLEGGRYPVTLATASARAAHPNGVRVRPENLVISDLDPRRAAEAMVDALVKAINTDMYPPGQRGGVGQGGGWPVEMHLCVQYGHAPASVAFKVSPWHDHGHGMVC